MQSIDKLEHGIRNFINRPRTQYALLQDSAAWNMLCSCLDTIGDTELAIKAYEESSNPSTVGDTYLLIYGALQALFVQQDTVENLCKALAIDYTRDNLLTDVREIRNDSIGHPTKRGGGQGSKYNVISRYNLTKAEFELMTTYPDERSPLFRRINMKSFIKTHRDILQRVLTEVLVKFEILGKVEQQLLASGLPASRLVKA